MKKTKKDTKIQAPVGKISGSQETKKHLGKPKEAKKEK